MSGRGRNDFSWFARRAGLLRLFQPLAPAGARHRA